MMRRLRCKCGKCTIETDSPVIYMCQGCPECQTTFAISPAGHQQLKDHKLEHMLDTKEINGVHTPFRGFDQCQYCRGEFNNVDYPEEENEKAE